MKDFQNRESYVEISNQFLVMLPIAIILVAWHAALLCYLDHETRGRPPT